MKLFDDLMRSIKLNNDDEYEFDDELDYDEDEDDEEEAPVKSRFFSRNQRNVDDDDDDEGYDDEPHSRFFGRSKVTPIRSTKPTMEVTMLRPKSMEDSRDICDCLLAGKAVVLNMEGLHMDLAQRIIDFTSGATYSMDGNLQKISSYIFIATPHNVELSGDFQTILNTAENNAAMQSSLKLRMG